MMDDMSTLVAKIYESLGDWRAAMARANCEAIAGEPTDADITLDLIEDLTHEVPRMTDRHKHADTCWQKNASCLADRIDNILSER